MVQIIRLSLTFRYISWNVPFILVDFRAWKDTAAYVNHKAFDCSMHWDESFDYYKHKSKGSPKNVREWYLWTSRVMFDAKLLDFIFLMYKIYSSAAREKGTHNMFRCAITRISLCFFLLQQKQEGAGDSSVQLCLSTESSYLEHMPNEKDRGRGPLNRSKKRG